MRLNALFTIVFLCCLGAAVQVRSAILLSETWTGEQLYQNSLSSDPRVTFPTRTPVLDGTSLFFDTGNTDYNRLLALELVPQNSLNPAHAVIVNLLVNLTVQPCDWPTYRDDHDPGIGVGDGNLLAAFRAADNEGGSADAILFGGWSEYKPWLFTNAGYPSIGGSFTINSTITLTTASTEVQGGFLNGSGSHTFPEALNLNSRLSFVFFAAEGNERYQLNWLSVKVQGTQASPIPEPTTLITWLGLTGIALLAAYRRRKRNAERLLVGCNTDKSWHPSTSPVLARSHVDAAGGSFH